MSSGRPEQPGRSIADRLRERLARPGAALCSAVYTPVPLVNERKRCVTDALPGRQIGHGLSLDADAVLSHLGGSMRS